MANIVVTVVVAVLVGTLVVLLNLAITTRKTTELQKTIDLLADDLKDRMDTSARVQLLNSKQLHRADNVSATYVSDFYCVMRR